MARGRQKQNLSALLMLGVIFCIYLVFEFITQNALLVISVAVVVVSILILAASSRRRVRRQVFESARAIIERHSEQLAKRRAQLVRTDSYGKPLLEKWHSEIDYFITEHVLPSFTSKQQLMLNGMRQEMFILIVKRAECFGERAQVFKAFSESMTPTEFEAFCAEQLRSHGWDAQLTRTTGDQGVDVIAQKGGMRVVLQCKLYSGPVGNSAIQEVVAGKAYERADRCAVVSNNRYTPAAEQLAVANGVLLLHYSDLPKLEGLLRPTSMTAAAPSGVSVFSDPGISPPVPEVVRQPNQIASEPEREQRIPNSQNRSILAFAVLLVSGILIGGTILYITRSSAGPAAEQRRVEVSYRTYANERFGFRIDYPNTFITRSGDQDENGLTATSADGAASLVVSGDINAAQLTAKDVYDEVVRSVKGELGYHRLGGSWFVVTWVDSGQIVYRKTFVGTGSLNSFTFTFPDNQRFTYEPVITRIEKSFRPGALNQAR